ncbi:hypothetical protein [Spirochaeta lutea]|nr:hypothetical protein [Spirochaeta lutea]
MLGTLFTVLVGVVLGYVFKPQIDRALKKVVRKLEDKSKDDYRDF